MTLRQHIESLTTEHLRAGVSAVALASMLMRNAQELLAISARAQEIERRELVRLRRQVKRKAKR